MPYKIKSEALAANRRSYSALMAIPAKREARAVSRAAYMRGYYQRSATHRAGVRRRTRAWGNANKEWRNFCSTLYRYRLTLDQYHAKAESQDFLCALCQEVEPQVVDHNHKTGAVRGLLCRTCNTGFGQFKESLDLLDRAKAYAVRWV